MKIAVIGDLMLDKYDFCRNRANPESSAPCYTIERTEYKPGGAGNVALNLVRLGSEINLFSNIGNDENGEILLKTLDSLNIPHKIIIDERKPTIVKERTMSSEDGRYHYRKDRESKEYIQENHILEIIEDIKNDNYGLILVSDYRKGMISEKLMNEIKERKVPILADIKPEHKKFYNGVFMIKPNSKEAREMTGLEDDLEAAIKLKKDLETNVLLTRGERGMVYFGGDKERFEFEANNKKFFDTTGAGDTVIATFAHFFEKKYPLKDCVYLSNKAAGISIQYPGCYAVSEEEVFN